MFERRSAKTLIAIMALCWLNACSNARPAAGLDAPRLHHVAVVWLKAAGDEALRRQYVEASLSLAHLPGIVSYSAGTPAEVRRSRANAAVDESYDVAISAVFENSEAYQAFLQHPDYVKLAQQVLRPLVDRYKVYDFAAP
ncbi:MAG: Dabb family protein [Methylomonas sp.]|nr:Dabb family protein [Methylomonas sp.]